jgi:hypothetical protein
MKRLTLAVAGPAFCLGALSQDLTLSIEPAVHVTWPSTTNKAYQVEVSSNLAGNWAAAGPLVEGTGGRVGAYLDRTTITEFFRVQETAASGMSWLNGVWQGEVYQASSNSVPFTTVISIASSSRTFRATYSNNTFSCAANLDLLSYSDGEARFYSAIQSGPCLNGALIVTRVNATNVLYNWYSPNGPTVASSFAVLSKRQ